MPWCDLLRQNVSLGIMTSMATAEPVPAGSPTYIYIAGRGHSGSTLLTMLLARHRDVEAVGEMSLLSLQIARDETTRWVGRCSCGERPIDCSMWGKVLSDIESEEGVDFKSNPFAWRVSDVGMEEEYRGAAPFRVPFVWLRNRFWRLIRADQLGATSSSDTYTVMRCAAFRSASTCDSNAEASASGAIRTRSLIGSASAFSAANSSSAPIAALDPSE